MLLQGVNRRRVPFWDGDERNVIAVAGVSHLRMLDEFHINRPHFPQKSVSHAGISQWAAAYRPRRQTGGF